VTEGKRMGVKEFYLTGGESFLNKEIYDILADTLAVGPASVLTNGTVIRQRVAARLKAISDASIYSLELRVSLDGFDAASNDRLRGAGSFDLAIKGIKALVEVGFLPIITAVQTWTDCERSQILENFKRTMREIGYTRPRIKIIPALNLGEHKRNRKDDPQEYLVTEEMMAVSDPGQLLCSNSRIVTDKGVFVCPILVDARDANLGATLEAASGPYRLSHKACYTCYMAGAICSNFASSAREAASSPTANHKRSQE
ncbi:MAG TPA: radical SAM protein, partial [candidate division Zixibacteria bacterium]|nr:radical SAM protein [candidate division Zixibacteria bacterium]